jgi:hypothetical protein
VDQAINRHLFATLILAFTAHWVGLVRFKGRPNFLLVYLESSGESQPLDRRWVAILEPISNLARTQFEHQLFFVVFAKNSGLHVSEHTLMLAHRYTVLRARELLFVCPSQYIRTYKYESRVTDFWLG